jgi:elongation factor P--(R)-beta-lysine ligase
MNFETAIKRAEIIRTIRDFFTSRNVLEVETPVVSHGTPTDCHSDLFSTAYHPAGARKQAGNETVYLRTSPEFHMKRLLASGYRDIFQIGKVFRNGERGRIHNPEFTMLEWYRTDRDMSACMDETAALISAVLGKKKIIKKNYAELFMEATGIDPLGGSLRAVIECCASRGKIPPEFATLTDALQFAMAELVEPGFPADALVIVHHYPADQAVLAMLEPGDQRVAKRFEVYSGGCELANGFEELVDWKENERRQQEENAKRAACGKEQRPVDQAFIDALKKGLPPCSGVALGLDRLIMLALKKQSIDEVLPFAWEKS